MTNTEFVYLLHVLIDTWWNVNVEQLGQYDIGQRFNRYMVECECIFQNYMMIL